MRVVGVVLLSAVLLSGCRAKPTPPVTLPVLTYDAGRPKSPPAYAWSSVNDPYLMQMYSRYALDRVMEGTSSDLDRVKRASRWAHTQFPHDADNASKYADPMGILAEAATGKRFRSLEYATVTAGVLTAVGIPSRIVWLLTSTEATRTDGVAHVITEAYLRDLRKWVVVDAQWDAVPLVDSVPVSALELQKAIASKNGVITISSMSGTTAGSYTRWSAPYLYYFFSRIDNRIGVVRQAYVLLLTPIGDTSLAQKYPGPVHRLTHSVAEFYPSFP